MRIEDKKLLFQKLKRSVYKEEWLIYYSSILGNSTLHQCNTILSFLSGYF